MAVDSPMVVHSECGRMFNVNNSLVIKCIVGVVLVSFVGLEAVSAGFLPPAYFLTFLFVGILFSMAYLSNRTRTHAIQTVWRNAAEKLELNCRRIGDPLGSKVVIDGVRNNRDVEIYVQGHGISQVMISRIELSLNIESPIALRIWGPAEGKQDDLDKKMYEATDSHRFGKEVPFYMRSSPKRLGNHLFTESVWEELPNFTDKTNIEIDGSKIFLEQPGVWLRADVIYSMVNTLEAFAQAVELWESRMAMWEVAEQVA